ncbi:MAG: hypothetical protein M3Z13_02605 [Candidatus Dormibacteraeota bacterium]|nr:hypothetical protein [Candidatus Dormibacteraeota bacterium]
MEQVVLRVLRSEVRRRKCPGCANSLRRADIEANFRNDNNIQLHFRCRFCSFEGGGEFELTAEMCREAAQIATAEGDDSQVAEAVAMPDLDPITGDDLITVHQVLAGWRGDFSQLFQASSV